MEDYKLTFGAFDPYYGTDIGTMIQDLLAGTGATTTKAKNNDLSKALDDLFDGTDELKDKATKEMAAGAVLKTIGAASDTFNRLTGILAGQGGLIKESGELAAENYDIQMKALDNQVTYLKNQLADRFNKTVETNIMNLAAKNLRVTAGSVLELSKEAAQEITEDIRMAESNAALRKIALEAGKAKAKESSKYAIKQMWTGLFSSASKLGLMIATGGGTGESWGNMFGGKNMSSAIEKQSFNELYKG